MDGGELLGGVASAIISSGTAADEKGAYAVAFDVVIHIALGSLDETFAAGVFPHAAVVHAFLGTHGRLVDMVVENEVGGSTADADMHFGLEGVLGSPVELVEEDIVHNII